ncbi:MAG: hypothetical protein JWR18_1722 [Segetibacter sp.]|jgi:hypothetical protein|nr:hypothetical protein [Segetibacter sp.]
MDKNKNKGLADNQEGEFILNESGTSVSIDPDIDFTEDEETSRSDDAEANEEDKQKVEKDHQK